MRKASTDTSRALAQATIIHNVRLGTANGLSEPRDVLVQNGVLTIDPGTPGNVVEDVVEIEGRGLVLAPAFLELHAHMREPGGEAKETLSSGLAAAAAGGYGTLVSMPNTNPVIDEPLLVSELIARAEAIGRTKLRPAAALTKGQLGERLTDAAALQAAGAVMLTDDGKTNERADVLRRGMEYAGELSLVVSVHAEDAGLRAAGVMNEGSVSERLGLPGNPASSEAARIARDLEICRYIHERGLNVRLHIQHLSTARGLELVREAKDRGLPVTCEVTPHHLTLTDEALASFDPIYKVAPPLRRETDCEALLAGLIDGTVDAIATDHAPHTRAEKDADMLEAPFGIANIEVCFPLLYTRFVATGRLKLERLLELLTDGPASVLGWPSPTLTPGQRLDLPDFVLLDLDQASPVNPETFYSLAKFSPWAGETLSGWPLLTLVNGHIAFEAPALETRLRSGNAVR